ncbi:MAG: DUF456 domain-containing protein [Akkermansia sp.]|nr:DUF456 domain-containing protein [Akkermansia sp.]
MPEMLSDTLIDILIYSVSGLLFALGIAGTIVPLLPGILLISLACLWQGLLGDSHIVWWEWLILALLAALGFFIDKICAAYGAKQFGSTKAGVIASIIGLIIGSILFSPFVGIFVIPFLCALGAELIWGKQPFVNALKAGSGTVLGLLSGIIVEFFLGVTMIALFFIFYYSA